MANKRPKSHRSRNNPNMKENLFRILLFILIIIAGIVLPRLIHKGSNLIVENIVSTNTNVKETQKNETEEEGMYSTGNGQEETESAAIAREKENPPSSQAPSVSSEITPGESEPDSESESESESETQAPQEQTDASGMVSVSVPGGADTPPQPSGQSQDTPADSQGGTNTASPGGTNPSQTTASPAVSDGNNVTEGGTSLIADDVVMSGPEIQIPASGVAETVVTDGMDQNQISSAQADANFVANFSPRIVLATESFEEELFGPADTDGQIFLKRLGTYVVDTFGNWVTVPTVEIRERLSGSKELGNATYRIKMYVQNELGETEEHFAIVSYYPDNKDYSVYYADTEE